MKKGEVCHFPIVWPIVPTFYSRAVLSVNVVELGRPVALSVVKTIEFRYLPNDSVQISS